MRKLVGVAILLLAAGCGESHDFYAEVESNTSWVGGFGNRTVEGTGNKTVDLPDNGDVQCVAVQKLEESGYLDLKVKDHVTGGSIFGIGGGDDVELKEHARTTAAYGMVTACNQ